MSKFSVLLILLIVSAVLLGAAGLTVAYLETKTLQGSVTDTNGAPLARAAIALAGHSTFSDEQGTFEIQFPRGDWELRAFADGFESTVLQVNAADVWQRGFSTALTLKAQEWRGQVRASDTQEPLAGATVELNGASLITNEQGEFSARGVRNGTKIKIQKPGYRAVTVTVQSARNSERVTTLSLPPSELRVTVIDATSQKPLPGVPVTANGSSKNTDVNGVVVLKGLEENAVISAKAPGYASASANVGSNSQITLSLQPTSLHGRALDAQTQTAISNALVIVENTDGSFAPPRQTDANGNFALDDFTQTPKLYLKKPGYLLGAFDLKQGGKQDFTLTPFNAIGIHFYYGVTREAAERVLEQFKNTQMNAVVFDVKEDPGYLMWDSQVPLAKTIGAYTPRSYTAQQQVETCRAYKLYCIARLTIFKDSLLAKARPDLALHNGGGGLLYENFAYWTNPAEKEVQDYHIALAKELGAMGFDEIQYDYIRFPGTVNLLRREFGDAEYRVATIQDFLERSAEELKNTTVYFSGDVFGLTTAIEDEQGIGQVWEKVAPPFDYISPMMYPSTWRYSTNLWGASFDIRNCADAYACPYDIMRYGTLRAQARTKNNWTLVRPWLQAYGMTLQQMLAQSSGANDAASAGYLFWNNQGLYPDGLFKKQ